SLLRNRIPQLFDIGFKLIRRRRHLSASWCDREQQGKELRKHWCRTHGHLSRAVSHTKRSGPDPHAKLSSPDDDQRAAGDSKRATSCTELQMSRALSAGQWPKSRVPLGATTFSRVISSTRGP